MKHISVVRAIAKIAARYAVKIRWVTLLILLPMLLSCVGEGTTVTATEGVVAPVNGSVSVIGETGIPAAEEVTDAGQVEPIVEPQSDSPAQTPIDTSATFFGTELDVTDLVLITGQSNTLGAGTAFDAFLDAPDIQVLAYTDTGWQIADLNQRWDRGFPLNDPNTPPSNNFGLHFGKRVSNRTSGRVVGVILVSSPGSSISDWGPESDLFNFIRSRVSQAINELPFKRQLDGILWHQGESDGADFDQYGTALYDLIERFRSEPWFSSDRPFICGETAALPVNNQLRRLNTDDDPWTACVQAEGLAVLPGTAHFTAESLRTLGQRYADAYLEMYLGIE